MQTYKGMPRIHQLDAFMLDVYLSVWCMLPKIWQRGSFFFLFQFTVLFMFLSWHYISTLLIDFICITYADEGSCSYASACPHDVTLYHVGVTRWLLHLWFSSQTIVPQLWLMGVYTIDTSSMLIWNPRVIYVDGVCIRCTVVSCHTPFHINNDGSLVWIITHCVWWCTL